VASRAAVKNPQDYEARSNIMWTATWALNTLIKCGKSQDWMVHQIGHSIGAWTHAPHGYTLASVTMPYYKRALKYGRPKFERFARNVWGVNTAEEGLEALKNWMLEIGLPLTITELGANEAMIDDIVSTTNIFPAGYMDLTAEDIKEILKESL
jgi:alcohol dehydrogenase YqhD (iron-dependent ADH family)